MTASVHIIAVGARTPLGLRAASSAAALRAGISSLGCHPFMVDRVGDPMPGALDHALDPGMTGPTRLVAMAESALREVCALLENSKGPPLRLPVYLGLPEYRPGLTSGMPMRFNVGSKTLTTFRCKFRRLRPQLKGMLQGCSRSLRPLNISEGV